MARGGGGANSKGRVPKTLHRLVVGSDDVINVRVFSVSADPNNGDTRGGFLRHLLHWRNARRLHINLIYLNISKIIY